MKRAHPPAMSTDHPELQKLFSNKLSRLYQYSITVKYVFRRKDNSEATSEISKSFYPKLVEHDKKRCEQVYRKAIVQFNRLRQKGVYLYDRQSTLYSTVELPDKKLSFTITEGLSRRPNFIRAELMLERNKNAFEVTTKVLDEPSNLTLKHTLNYGSCNHYTVIS